MTDYSFRIEGKDIVINIAINIAINIMIKFVYWFQWNVRRDTTLATIRVNLVLSGGMVVPLDSVCVVIVMLVWVH